MYARNRIGLQYISRVAQLGSDFMYFNAVFLFFLMKQESILKEFGIQSSWEAQLYAYAYY